MDEVSLESERRSSLRLLLLLWVGQTVLAFVELGYLFALPRLNLGTLRPVTAVISGVSTFGTVALLVGMAFAARRLGSSAPSSRARKACQIAVGLLILQAVAWGARYLVGPGWFSFAGGAAEGLLLMRVGLGTLQLAAAGALVACVWFGGRDSGRPLPGPLTGTMLLFYVLLVFRMLFAQQLPSGLLFVAWSVIVALLIHSARAEPGTAAEASAEGLESATGLSLFAWGLVVFVGLAVTALAIEIKGSESSVLALALFLVGALVPGAGLVRFASTSTRSTAAAWASVGLNLAAVAAGLFAFLSLQESAAHFRSSAGSNHLMLALPLSVLFSCASTCALAFVLSRRGSRPSGTLESGIFIGAAILTVLSLGTLGGQGAGSVNDLGSLRMFGAIVFGAVNLLLGMTLGFRGARAALRAPESPIITE